MVRIGAPAGSVGSVVRCRFAPRVDHAHRDSQGPKAHCNFKVLSQPIDRPQMKARRRDFWILLSRHLLLGVPIQSRHEKSTFIHSAPHPFSAAASPRTNPLVRPCLPSHGPGILAKVGLGRSWHPLSADLLYLVASNFKRPFLVLLLF